MDVDPLPQELAPIAIKMPAPGAGRGQRGLLASRPEPKFTAVMPASSPDRSVQGWMRLSLFVGLGVLALKITAYVLSHSQALLADVAESVVHQLAVGVATYLAYLQLQPADRNHPHGHGKFGFISSGLEGSLILVTGLVILLSSLTHLMHPAPIDVSVLSMVLVAATLVINGVLGFALVRHGKKVRSLLLEANGHHVFTDSWTSLGALVAMVLVKLTGNPLMDALSSCVIALVIIYSGATITWRAFHGLTDGVNPAETEAISGKLGEAVLRQEGRVHDIQIRHDSLVIWVQAHVTFARDESLGQIHDRLTAIETEMRGHFPEVRTLLHPEPEGAPPHA
ncbi:MAG: cation diffusion facilitator family transporter [Opitutae bacterium]